MLGRGEVRPFQRLPAQYSLVRAVFIPLDSSRVVVSVLGRTSYMMGLGTHEASRVDNVALSYGQKRKRRH